MKKYKNDEKKRKAKLMALKNSMVKKVIFENALRRAANNKTGQKTIHNFFG